LRVAAADRIITGTSLRLIFGLIVPSVQIKRALPLVPAGDQLDQKGTLPFGLSVGRWASTWAKKRWVRSGSGMTFDMDTLPKSPDATGDGVSHFKISFFEGGHISDASSPIIPIPITSTASATGS
jgi:hypothetical protein